jgi:8-oxo-dGTP pyrophosphatase MutT (NUDIX family)
LNSLPSSYIISGEKIMNYLTEPLEIYGREHPNEKETAALIHAYLADSAALSAEHRRGHFTGSVWIINSARDRILMTHHTKLNMWLQPGGHLDQGETALEGALREAQEETGITGFRLLKEGLFDIDVHHIPARKGEPSHYHYDLRFLIEADSDAALTITPESQDLQWVLIDEIPRYSRSESILRMVRKTVPYASRPLFGQVEEKEEYEERIGIYGLISDGQGRVALMKTPFGYLLPGGGLEKGESHGECLSRELAEEAGWAVKVGDYEGFSCLYSYISRLGVYKKMSGHFYRLEQTGILGKPVEEDHEVQWHHPHRAAELLGHEHQAWAVRKVFSA